VDDDLPDNDYNLHAEPHPAVIGKVAFKNAIGITVLRFKSYSLMIHLTEKELNDLGYYKRAK
jgi:hypothetical protein